MNDRQEHKEHERAKDKELASKLLRDAKEQVERENRQHQE